MPAVLAKPTKQSSTRPTEPAIDVTHLGRMTFGEKGLEAEVLQLFDRQAGMLLARIEAASTEAVASFAHILKGSARGIGAWQVAKAAEAVELAAGVGDAAVATARAAISELLRTPVTQRRS